MSSSRSRQSRGESTKPKKDPKYTAVRVIGSGSFGVVYEAVCNETGETVAIKKVLEDRRYKNRELQIMKRVKHTNIVNLRDCFYSRGGRGRSSGRDSSNREVYLNLVMDYVPETVYVTIRNHSRARQTIPYIYTKVYAYQICRALAYCHALGICHRDIKPQNLLLNPETHAVKLCDFGSAKVLQEGEPNVAYICSRYYRAPELIFESSRYKTTIDLWSLGCVVAELFLATPLFQGGSGVDQLVEIIKVLGAPTRDQILDMNPNYTQYRFPSVKPLSWEKVFSQVQWNGEDVPPLGIDLISKLLVFSPQQRVRAFVALSHPWFDELRQTSTYLPNGRPLPPLFDFASEEIELARSMGLYEKIVPAHVREAHDE